MKKSGSSMRTTDEQVRIRQRQWLGQVLRMSSDKNLEIALTWTPEGKRRRGGPRETWRRNISKERERLGFKSWGEAEVAARDRAAWRKRINGSILHQERRHDDGGYK